jgi:ferredoxin
MGERHGVTAAVDRAQCVGNGVCVALAPAAFALDQNMKAVVVDPEGESEMSLVAAAEACPTQAIYLSVDGQALYP